MDFTTNLFKFGLFWVNSTAEQATTKGNENIKTKQEVDSEATIHNVFSFPKL